MLDDSEQIVNSGVRKVPKPSYTYRTIHKHTAIRHCSNLDKRTTSVSAGLEQSDFARQMRRELTLRPELLRLWMSFYQALARGEPISAGGRSMQEAAKLLGQVQSFLQFKQAILRVDREIHASMQVLAARPKQFRTSEPLDAAVLSALCVLTLFVGKALRWRSR